MVGKHWNRLPREAVKSPFLKLFKKWIWHLEPWFSGEHDSAGSMVGLNDLEGLFQSKLFCESGKSSAVQRVCGQSWVSFSFPQEQLKPICVVLWSPVLISFMGRMFGISSSCFHSEIMVAVHARMKRPFQRPKIPLVRKMYQNVLFLPSWFCVLPLSVFFSYRKPEVRPNLFE